MKQEKKKILVFLPIYLPGVKGGGPIKSVKNIVDNLNDIYDFYIVTSDRDLGDSKPYENIIVNTWVENENVNIIYTTQDWYNVDNVKKILEMKKWECIYLNGFFGYRFSILPMWIIKFYNKKNIRVVVAPRGEFDEGALSLKSTKKKLYLIISKIFRVYKKIKWHATCIEEIKNIENIYGEIAKIQLATNLTDIKSQTNYFDEKPLKIEGEINIIFLSRISPKKNLLFALETLKYLKGRVTLDIYGPIEDQDYWNKCQDIIKKSSGNIRINYKGLIENSHVQETVSRYNLFYLPTQGENYGHAIIEAFLSACPVLISDKTPWTNLENKECGWDIELNNKEKYRQTLQKIIDMDNEKYKRYVLAAYQYGISKLSSKEDIENHSKLFE